MVFGYYHITMRTAEQDFARNLGCPPNGKISQKVKVGHIMWIPFIPLGKVWMMDAAGKSYKLQSQAESALNFEYGEKGMPWYSFLGLILIIVLPAIFTTMSSYNSKKRAERHKAQFEEKVNKRIAAIDNAKVTDYYHFKGDRNGKLVMKVDKVIGDSIRFEAPIDNDGKKWNDDNWAVSFYNGDFPSQLLSIAKSDLKTNFRTNYNKYDSYKKLNIPQLPFLQGLKSEKIVHMENVATDNLPVLDAKEMEEVKSSVLRFVANISNGDSLINNMSESSKKYYEDMLTNARKNDYEAKKYINSLQKNNHFFNSLSHYETMLYTKYVYLKTGTENEKSLEDSLEDFSGYIFFLRLLDRSFLNVGNDAFQGLKIIDVEIPSKTQSKVKLSAKSNILKSPKLINFTIDLDKLDGEWKVFVPSSYSYTDKQVLGAGDISNIYQISAEFKKMIRGNVEEILGETLPDTWK